MFYSSVYGTFCIVSKKNGNTKADWGLLNQTPWNVYIEVTLVR